MMRAITILFAFCAVSAFGQSITATKSYVDRKYAEATNAVAAIVTNEVAGGGAWSIEPDTWQELPLTIRHNGSSYALYLDGNEAGDVSGDAPHPPTNGLRLVYRAGLDWLGDCDVVAEFGGATVKNALGLARLKDIEPLPSAETVTNIVRDQIGTVWDGALGVAWEARMHNGNLYYIATTNVQEVK